MNKIVLPIAALLPVLGLVGVLGLIAPIVVRAETAAEPSATPEGSVTALPPPTILRGSRPAPAQSAPAQSIAGQPVPVCPPGYILIPGYGCTGASAGDYAEGSPDYSYWPDYGWGYPFGGLLAPGSGASRFHRVAKSHGFRGFPRSAGFHGPARFGGFTIGAGHMGSFGRR